ncbi:MAG: DUF4406 domain-containing protein [Prevotella sp.]
MNKIYLSLPISGYDYSERKQLSMQVQMELEKRGYEVFNPMFNGLPKDATTHEHMRVDFKMLCECNEIIMLPKWNHSAGCLQEFGVAASIGCEVKFLLSVEPFIIVESKFD